MGEPSTFAGAAEETVWKALHESYEAWYATLRTRAAPHMSRELGTWQPAPSYGSPAWWACMVTRRLDNFQLVCAKHTEHGQRPITLDGLPVEEESEREEIKTGENSSEAESHDAPVRQDMAEVGDMTSDEEPVRTRVYPSVLGTRCGRLPLGVEANTF